MLQKTIWRSGVLERDARLGCDLGSGYDRLPRRATRWMPWVVASATSARVVVGRLANSKSLRLAHRPSTGLSSGAWAGSRSAVSQSRWLSNQARILVLQWADSPSQMSTIRWPA